MTGSGTEKSRRRFDYDRALLPNPRLAALEPDDIADLESALPRTGLTIGYPAWNLLYYALLCSLPPGLSEPVVVETGTNRGLSTIVMAQALKDLGLEAAVETVEVDEDLVALARSNVEAAGLGDHVVFHVGDSLSFLRNLADRTDHIDFAFVDASHDYEDVVAEIEILHSMVAARRGKIYFDNTSRGGVAKALKVLRERHGGSLLEFENCSWKPPGNAIWQSD